MTEGTTEPTANRLVIAYAFAPYTDTSAAVAAKRVRAHGQPVDLVQNAMEEIRSLDPTLDQVAGDLIRRRRVLPTLTRFGSWASITEFCTAGLDVIEEWENDQGPYRSVYSRAHFVASHFLAARHKIRRPGVVWEAEFSDPLSRNGVGQLRDSVVSEGVLLEELRAGILAAGGTPPDSDNVYVWGEYATLTLADQLLFTNTTQREYIFDLYDPQDPVITRARERATVAAHPTPPAELYDAAPSEYLLDPERINIGYFGNFYASQRPEDVLRACADLARADRERIRLHVFTGAIDELSQTVQAAGADDVVTVLPRLPYLEFLHLAKRLDVLLAVDAGSPPGQKRSPVLLSKWSDYAGAGTPVWGVVEEGSALDAQDLTYRSPLGHRTAALQVLTSLSRSNAANTQV